MARKIGLGVLALILFIALIFLGRFVVQRIAARDSDQQQVTDIVTPVPTASPTPTPVATVTTSTPTPQPTATPSPKPTILPEINLNVPFTPQAPSANWDDTHEETCEEASILMASWYATGKSGVKQGSYANLIPTSQAEDGLTELVSWQQSTFGFFKDTNAEQTARMAREELGLKDVQVKATVTAQSIKEELNKGRVVVVPAAGRRLGNPYFTPPGPQYHMLLIRGYNQNGFITNEPGTKRGEGYVYKESVLLDAVHDWTGDKETIEQGRKVMISIGKN